VLSSRDSSRCISSSWPWLRHNEWVCCIRKNEKSKKILLAIRIIEPWRLNWDPFISVAFSPFYCLFYCFVACWFYFRTFFCSTTYLKLADGETENILLRHANSPLIIYHWYQKSEKFFWNIKCWCKVK
jgi:hypothetical protein